AHCVRVLGAILAFSSGSRKYWGSTDEHPDRLCEQAVSHRRQGVQASIRTPDLSQRRLPATNRQQSSVLGLWTAVRRSPAERNSSKISNGSCGMWALPVLRHTFAPPFRRPLDARFAAYLLPPHNQLWRVTTARRRERRASLSVGRCTEARPPPALAEVMCAQRHMPGPPKGQPASPRDTNHALFLVLCGPNGGSGQPGI